MVQNNHPSPVFNAANTQDNGKRKDKSKKMISSKTVLTTNLKEMKKQQLSIKKDDLKKRLTLDVESVYSPNQKSKIDFRTASPSKDKL